MRVSETPDAPTGNAGGRFPYGQSVVAGRLIFVSVEGLVISMAVIAEA